MVMPIARTQPSGVVLNWVENSFATRRNPTEKKSKGREDPALTALRSQCCRLRLQEPGSGSEALEAYDLPSSRLANETAGTATRFIQAPPHLLCPTGVELRVESLANWRAAVGHRRHIFGAHAAHLRRCGLRSSSPPRNHRAGTPSGVRSLRCSAAPSS